MNNYPVIAVWVSEEEVDILTRYTRIPLQLLQKMTQAITQAKQKRQIVKWVKVNYSVNKLDKIIAFIAEKTNQNNSNDDIHYILNNLLGRFAERYNKIMHR